MTRYLFIADVVLNPDGSLGAGLDGQAFSSNVSGPEYTSDLLAIDQVSPIDYVTDSTGVPPAVFGPDEVTSLWVSFGGGPRFPLHGVDVTESLLQDYIHGTLAGASGIAGAPATWPSTFPPSAHSHPVAQISDATPVGRAVMSAPDGQTARAAIGAGTGNGTSNLTIGTTATTAAAGNHTHDAANLTAPVNAAVGLTATTISGQLAQAATSGGGGTGGAGDEYAVYYASGGYPTQAGSPPAGVKRRHFYGPSAYTGATWTGVLDLYTYAALS